ncbi:cytochrome b2 [Diplodia corticola]|uniref:Cytochrome b2 n=1 Tax=Diplodia corticola TaxID=236234 RepID=A0A1J9QL88_9PEZI|nr:cytochrome b2 [Diplodia corticola]OJD29225.1 cytochrome b2 [Diplodia corticola]
MADPKQLPYRIEDLEEQLNTKPSHPPNAKQGFVKPPPTATTELQAHEKPPLDSLINSYDFESVASRTLSQKTWAFYSSAATDEITRDANKSSFDRIWWRPRVLRDVSGVDTRSRILGNEVQLPLFVSPAAMARLVHPEGEKAIAAACGNKGVAQTASLTPTRRGGGTPQKEGGTPRGGRGGTPRSVHSVTNLHLQLRGEWASGQDISTNASYPVTDILPNAPANHPFFFQLYVNRDRQASERMLASLPKGIKAIFVTVDAPVPGKREADERVRADEALSAPMTGARAVNDKKGGGLGRIMGSYIDASLTWDDLRWLRSVTDLPIVLKGVQGAADARLAAQAGVQGIILSNHGGRSLDTAPPSILILLELQKCAPEVFEKLEVYVDSGIRRGTDILKCLCLGATAVGMGRHFLYALNYGREGVEHFIDVMRDELETSMKLIGITDLSQVHPGLVNTLEVDHLIPSTLDHPYAKWSKSRGFPKARL